MARPPGLIDAELESYLLAHTRKTLLRFVMCGSVAKPPRAKADRRVTLRPAPDVMAQLTALLPAAQGVAACAALARAGVMPANIDPDHTILYQITAVD